jgi:putative membrane protein insertion efficiency factor
MTPPTARPTIPALVLMAPVRAWRRVSAHLPPRCRFHPSCSEYALDALRIHGGARGGWLALRRLSRCHPWHGGGLDPVPPKDHRRTNTRSQSRVPVSHTADPR